MNKLIYGVGVNDANFIVQPTVNGVRQQIPSYVCWKNMLSRCYNNSISGEHPTYYDCTVVTEWYYYTKFHNWYESQQKDPGWHIDKDILNPGNKIYGPEFCVLLPRVLNNFVTDRGAMRGKLMLGVSLDRPTGKYKASCMNPFTGKQETLGRFSDEIEAHLAWKRRKHELACQYADTVNNPRLSQALRTRYNSGC